MKRLMSIALLATLLSPSVRADSLNDAEKWILEAMQSCEGKAQVADFRSCVETEWALIIQAYKVITYLRDDSTMPIAEYQVYLNSVVKALSRKVMDQIVEESRKTNLTAAQYGASSLFLARTIDLANQTSLETYSLPSQLLKVLTWQMRLASYTNLSKVPYEYEIQYNGVVKKLDDLLKGIINP